MKEKTTGLRLKKNEVMHLSINKQRDNKGFLYVCGFVLENDDYDEIVASLKKIFKEHFGGLRVLTAEEYKEYKRLKKENGD